MFGPKLVLLYLTSVVTLAVGCEATEVQRSQLLVVVNSNFEPGRELATVALRVDGEERTRVTLMADGKPTIPFSFGVLPPGGDTTAEVTVEAEALSADDEPLACPARAHVGFISGQARVVPLALTRACGTAACGCGDSETCVLGECVPYALDVSTLKSVEPGHELDGVEVLPSTTLPEPERPVCNADNDSWSDVARGLSRTHDGLLCPVMSDGTAWGSAAFTLDMNRQALSDYIDRHLEVEHDVITLQVAWIADELRVLGWLQNDADEPAVPTLREVLELPALQSAQQPLQLIVRDENLPRSILVETLPRILLDSGVVQRCRPIYLTAFEAASFSALRQLRESIRTQPRWSELWNLVHFTRRLSAFTTEAALAELDEAGAHGFDRVGIDARRVAFPVLRRTARARHVAMQLYNADSTDQVGDLCDGSSGIEAMLSTQRQPEIKYFDERRFQLSSARTLIELDVGGLEAGSDTLSYTGFPDLSVSRSLNLEASEPALVTGEMGTRWGDNGTVLRFSAEHQQKLTLHDATFYDERAGTRFFAWPVLSLMVTARLPASTLPMGTRQVLVSKLRGESGWALAFVNDGTGNVLQHMWYGRGREDGVVRVLKGSIPVGALLMQADAPTTIYVSNGRIAIWDQLQPVSLEPGVLNYNQHLMITNDAPITLGADPDGGDYFDGDIQSVKITTMYEGGKKAAK